MIRREWTAGGLPDWKVAGVADFNGDGNPDLLWQQQSTGAVIVWLITEWGYVYSQYLMPAACPTGRSSDRNRRRGRRTFPERKFPGPGLA